MISFLNRHLVQPFMAWRAGSPHLRHLRLLRERQFDDPATIRARQLDAVRQLLQHAYETVPHYRTGFEQRGLHPSDIRKLADLALLPVLTKADIRAHGSALRSSSFQNEALFHKKTSGSTGVPLAIAVNRESVQWKTACTIRSDEWSGWRLGQRVAKVWGNPEYRKHGLKGRIRNYFVDRARYLDTIGLDNERMSEFARVLSRKRPGLLFGHAHSLYLFACFVKKRFPQRIRPKGMISTAMILHDWQRVVIEEAFGCPVTNRYGCEEVSLIACECERHQGLHLNADSLYCEVIPDRAEAILLPLPRFGGEGRGEGVTLGAERDKSPTAASLSPSPCPLPRKAGGEGKSKAAAPLEGSLLVTDLTNLAMPLIRYKVGDVVVSSNRRCACGRGLPLIERVEGREADYVLTPAGTLISGISLTENFALHIRGAAQVQIVQEGLRHLRLRMVADAEFGPESRRQIEALVRNTFGPEMNYEVELVDVIPQEASGKYRFCISKIASDHLRAMAT